MMSATSRSSRVAWSRPPTASRPWRGLRISSTSPYSWRRRSIFRSTIDSRVSARPARRARAGRCPRSGRGRGRPSARPARPRVRPQVTSGMRRWRSRAKSARASTSGRGTDTDLRPRRARVDLGRDFLRRGRDQQDQGPARGHRGIGGPAREGGDVLALGRPRAVRGSQRVRVVDDDGHRSRGQAIRIPTSASSTTSARAGSAGSAPLRPSGLAERLLALGVGEDEAGGDVVGDDDRPPRAEPAQALGQRHERRRRTDARRARCRAGGTGATRPSGSARARPR